MNVKLSAQITAFRVTLDMGEEQAVCKATKLAKDGAWSLSIIRSDGEEASDACTATTMLWLMDEDQGKFSTRKLHKGTITTAICKYGENRGSRIIFSMPKIATQRIAREVNALLKNVDTRPKASEYFVSGSRQQIILDPATSFSPSTSSSTYRTWSERDVREEVLRLADEGDENGEDNDD